MSPAFYTVQDLADRWQVSEKQIRQWIRKGALPAVLLGSRLYRVAFSDAELFEATDSSALQRPDSAQPTVQRLSRAASS